MFKNKKKYKSNMKTLVKHLGFFEHFQFFKICHQLNPSGKPLLLTKKPSLYAAFLIRKNYYGLNISQKENKFCALAEHLACLAQHSTARPSFALGRSPLAGGLWPSARACYASPLAKPSSKLGQRLCFTLIALGLGFAWPPTLSASLKLEAKASHLHNENSIKKIKMLELKDSLMKKTVIQTIHFDSYLWVTLYLVLTESMYIFLGTDITKKNLPLVVKTQGNIARVSLKENIYNKKNHKRSLLSKEFNYNIFFQGQKKSKINSSLENLLPQPTNNIVKSYVPGMWNSKELVKSKARKLCNLKENKLKHTRGLSLGRTLNPFPTSFLKTRFELFGPVTFQTPSIFRDFRHCCALEFENDPDKSQKSNSPEDFLSQLPLGLRKHTDGLVFDYGTKLLPIPSFITNLGIFGRYKLQKQSLKYKMQIRNTCKLFLVYVFGSFCWLYYVNSSKQNESFTTKKASSLFQEIVFQNLPLFEKNYSSYTKESFSELWRSDKARPKTLAYASSFSEALSGGGKALAKAWPSEALGQRPPALAKGRALHNSQIFTNSSGFFLNKDKSSFESDTNEAALNILYSSFFRDFFIQNFIGSSQVNAIIDQSKSLVSCVSKTEKLDQNQNLDSWKTHTQTLSEAKLLPKVKSIDPCSKIDQTLKSIPASKLKPRELRVTEKAKTSIDSVPQKFTKEVKNKEFVFFARKPLFLREFMCCSYGSARANFASSFSEALSYGGKARFKELEDHAKLVESRALPLLGQNSKYFVSPSREQHYQHTKKAWSNSNESQALDSRLSYKNFMGKQRLSQNEQFLYSGTSAVLGPEFDFLPRQLEHIDRKNTLVNRHISNLEMRKIGFSVNFQPKLEVREELHWYDYLNPKSLLQQEKHRKKNIVDNTQKMFDIYQKSYPTSYKSKASWPFGISFMRAMPKYFGHKLHNISCGASNQPQLIPNIENTVNFENKVPSFDKIAQLKTGEDKHAFAQEPEEHSPLPVFQKPVDSDAQKPNIGSTDVTKTQDNATLGHSKNFKDLSKRDDEQNLSSQSSSHFTKLGSAIASSFSEALSYGGQAKPRPNATSLELGLWPKASAVARSMDNLWPNASLSQRLVTGPLAPNRTKDIFLSVRLQSGFNFPDAPVIKKNTENWKNGLVLNIKKDLVSNCHSLAIPKPISLFFNLSSDLPLGMEEIKSGQFLNKEREIVKKEQRKHKYQINKKATVKNTNLGTKLNNHFNVETIATNKSTVPKARKTQGLGSGLWPKQTKEVNWKQTIEKPFLELKYESFPIQDYISYNQSRSNCGYIHCSQKFVKKLDIIKKNSLTEQGQNALLTDLELLEPIRLRSGPGSGPGTKLKPRTEVPNGILPLESQIVGKTLSAFELVPKTNSIGGNFVDQRNTELWGKGVNTILAQTKSQSKNVKVTKGSPSLALATLNQRPPTLGLGSATPSKALIAEHTLEAKASSTAKSLSSELKAIDNEDVLKHRRSNLKTLLTPMVKLRETLVSIASAPLGRSINFICLDKNSDIQTFNDFWGLRVPKVLPRLFPKIEALPSISQSEQHRKSLNLGLARRSRLGPENFFGSGYLQLGERFTIEKIKNKNQISTLYNVHNGDVFHGRRFNRLRPAFPYATMGTSLKTVFGKKWHVKQSSRKITKTQKITNARLVTNWQVANFFDLDLLKTSKNGSNWPLLHTNPNSSVNTFKNSESTKAYGLWERSTRLSEALLDEISEPTVQSPELRETYKHNHPLNSLQSLLYFKRISGKTNNHIINPFKYYNPGTKRERNIEDTMLTLEGYKKSRLFPKIHTYYQGITVESLPIKFEQANQIIDEDIDLQSILGGMRQRTESKRLAENVTGASFLNDVGASQEQELQKKKKFRFTNCYPIRTLLVNGSQKSLPKNVRPIDSAEYYLSSSSADILDKAFIRRINQSTGLRERAKLGLGESLNWGAAPTYRGSKKAPICNVKGLTQTKGFYFEKIFATRTLKTEKSKLSSKGLFPENITSNSIFDHLTEGPKDTVHKITQTRYNSKNVKLLAQSLTKVLFFAAVLKGYKALAIPLSQSTQFLPAAFTEAIGLQSFQKKYRIITEGKTRQNFRNLAGAEKTLSELRDLIWIFRLVGTGTPKGERFLASFPYFGSKAGHQRRMFQFQERNRFLLVGPPGTGKTLLVKALAREANVPVIVQPVSQLRMIAGVENPVSALFHVARQIKPCIIFLDELDTLGTNLENLTTGLTGGPERTTEHKLGIRLARKYTYTLLLELDGLTSSTRDLLVIGATNRPETLNPALTRAGRFETLVNCNLPDEKQRFAVLSLYLSNYKQKVKMHSFYKAKKRQDQDHYTWTNSLRSNGGSFLGDQPWLTRTNSRGSGFLDKREVPDVLNYKKEKMQDKRYKHKHFDLLLSLYRQTPWEILSKKSNDLVVRRSLYTPKIQEQKIHEQSNKLFYIHYVAQKCSGLSQASIETVVNESALESMHKHQSSFYHTLQSLERAIESVRVLTSQPTNIYGFSNKKQISSQKKLLLAKKRWSKDVQFGVYKAYQITGSLIFLQKLQKLVSSTQCRELLGVFIKERLTKPWGPIINKQSLQFLLLDQYAGHASLSLYSSTRPQNCQLSSTFGLYKNPVDIGTNLLMFCGLIESSFVCGANSRYLEPENFTNRFNFFANHRKAKTCATVGGGLNLPTSTDSTPLSSLQSVQTSIQNTNITRNRKDQGFSFAKSDLFRLKEQILCQKFLKTTFISCPDKAKTRSFFINSKKRRLSGTENQSNFKDNLSAFNASSGSKWTLPIGASFSLQNKSKKSPSVSFSTAGVYNLLQKQVFRSVKLSNWLTTGWFRAYLSRPIFRYDNTEYIENKEYYPQNNYSPIFRRLSSSNVSTISHELTAINSTTRNLTELYNKSEQTSKAKSTNYSYITKVSFPRSRYSKNYFVSRSLDSKVIKSTISSNLEQNYYFSNSINGISKAGSVHLSQQLHSVKGKIYQEKTFSDIFRIPLENTNLALKSPNFKEFKIQTIGLAGKSSIYKKEHFFDQNSIPPKQSLYLAIAASAFHKGLLIMYKNRELIDYCVYNILRYGVLYEFSINDICKRF